MKWLSIFTHLKRTIRNYSHKKMQTHLAAKCFNRTLILMYQHIFLKGGGLSQKSMREIKTCRSLSRVPSVWRRIAWRAKRGEVGVSPRVIKIGKYCATRSRLRKKSIICTKFIKITAMKGHQKSRRFEGAPSLSFATPGKREEDWSRNVSRNGFWDH